MTGRARRRGEKRGAKKGGPNCVHPEIGASMKTLTLLHLAATMAMLLGGSLGSNADGFKGDEQQSQRDIELKRKRLEESSPTGSEEHTRAPFRKLKTVRIIIIRLGSNPSSWFQRALISQRPQSLALPNLVPRTRSRMVPFNNLALPYIISQ